MTIERQRVLWTNFPGAPGYTNFYSSGTMSTIAPAIRSFFEAIKALLPTSVTLVYPNTVDQINEATGAITGSYAYTPALANTTGTTAGIFSGATGAVVNWNTDTFINSRRVRGRSFLVPLSGSAFDTNGSLDDTKRGTIQTAAAALVTAGSGAFVVWHRPTQFTSGSAAAMTSAFVPDLAAVLRSRRT